MSDVTHTAAQAARPSSPITTAKHPLTFSATGGEYFRVWVVNLLLTIVTFGLYSPWAKVRTLRYFYQHTALDEHTLDFHGNPRRMFRGMAVVGVFLIAYQFASGFSVWAALVAAVAFCAVWPSLYRAGQQFRLAHTSWRGLRFSFLGDSSGAYRAVGLPLAMFLIPSALVTVAVDYLGDEVGGAAGLGFMGVLLLGFALLPYFLFSIKRYQHCGYALGGLRAEFRSSPGAFYKVFGLAFGLWLLLGVLAVLALVLGGLSLRREAGMSVLPVLALFGLVVAGYFLLIPYITVRLQNLVWSRTGNSHFRFKSELSVRAYLGLSVKNWLLMVCTLGLYYPWAAVATRRMRLEAVSLLTRVPLGELMASRASDGDAAGDAAADLAGIDFGV